MSTRSLSGSTVIVTGASSGLGAALARAFAAAGARPVLFARSRERLEAVAESCRQAGAEPLVVAGDVTVPESCAELVERAIERFGSLDVLVACAGLGMWARFDELGDPSVLRRVMDVNYFGLVQPAHFALPHLKRSAGLLVAVSSVQGKIGVPHHSGYAASKHAVQGFCDSLRMELRGTGVDVLTVLAHWIRGTGLREHALGPDGEPRGQSSARHGSGAVTPEDVTGALLRAVEKRARTLFVPAHLRFLPLLAEAAPRLTERFIVRAVEREAAGP